MAADEVIIDSHNVDHYFDDFFNLNHDVDDDDVSSNIIHLPDRPFGKSDPTHFADFDDDFFVGSTSASRSPSSSSTTSTSANLLGGQNLTSNLNVAFPRFEIILLGLPEVRIQH